MHLEHRDIHHTAPFETHFFITIGWWNPVLAKLRFCEKLEGTIAGFTGLRPAVAGA